MEFQQYTIFDDFTTYLHSRPLKVHHPPSLSPFAPSCQKLGSTLKGRRRRRREGELGGPVEQQDETFCRSQCVAQHVRSLLQQNSDNNKMQSCMYRHFMKDTKGKELKHNAVETSGRLASYYIILLQSPLLFFQSSMEE